jgi:hypothetical protein
MLVIPLIWELVDGLALSADALVEPELAAAALSAVESGLGEQAVSVTKLIRIAGPFAAEENTVIVLLSVEDDHTNGF